MTQKIASTRPRPTSPVSRPPSLAFTLIEVLVAIAILIVVMTSTMVIFRGVSRAWRSGELKADRYQQARLLFDLFAREISSAVENTRFPLVGLDAKGDERFNEASVGDAFYFVGTLPGRTGLVERGYWLNGDDQLMCHDDEPADGDYTSGYSELCASGISEFRVSFYDGTAWLNEWDAREITGHEGKLPKAIRIILTIDGDAPKQFETVIYVPTS